MSTAVNSDVETLSITRVWLDDGYVHFELSGGRRIGLPLTSRYLRWLRRAQPEKQANHRILPGGWAVEWPELEEGIELVHLLGDKPF